MGVPASAHVPGSALYDLLQHQIRNHSCSACNRHQPADMLELIAVCIPDHVSKQIYPRVCFFKFKLTDSWGSVGLMLCCLACI